MFLQWKVGYACFNHGHSTSEQKNLPFKDSFPCAFPRSVPRKETVESKVSTTHCESQGKVCRRTRRELGVQTVACERALVPVPIYAT